MGILSNIFAKIFHKESDSATEGKGGSKPEIGASSAAASPAAPAPSQQATATAISETDVEALLNGMAAKQSQKLNWQTSIVDLMKLLGIDSSLESRKDLARELNYSGDMNDSATMNIWLHKQVMKQVAANGGKVPAALLD